MEQRGLKKVAKTDLPELILHNSVSLDGSLTGFEPNMELHYRIAGNYKPDVHLIGSATIKKGIEMYGDGVPMEEKEDFVRPKRNKNIPYWAIIDTRGKLKGLLHTCRRFEFCRDVIVVVSGKTPKSYLQHLKERNYDYHIVGKDRADLKKTLELLLKKYKAKRILADTGKILGNLLLNQGLVDEISLLVHPVIVGKSAYNMFGDAAGNISLKLFKQELLDKDYIRLIYKVRS